MHKIIIDDVNNLFEEGMHTRVPPRFFFGGGGIGKFGIYFRTRNERNRRTKAVLRKMEYGKSRF